MGHSQATKAATRQRIVEVAAQRFREHGLSGIGLAEIAAEAGITAGAIYRHFGSREEMVAEAIHEAARSLDIWMAGSADSGQAVGNYLNASHRDQPGIGCPVATLANDMVHADAATRDAYTVHVERVLGFLEALLARTGHENPRAMAILQYTACVGALGFSRAVSDREFSDDVLRDVASDLTTLAGR